MLESPQGLGRLPRQLSSTDLNYEQLRTDLWVSGGPMRKKRRLNRRLDAPHVRLYRWLLDSAAYLALSCPARAILVEIARNYDGMDNGRIGLSVRRAAKRCRTAPETATSLSGTRREGFHRVRDKRGVQPEVSTCH